MRHLDFWPLLKWATFSFYLYRDFTNARSSICSKVLQYVSPARCACRYRPLCEMWPP